MEQKKVVSPFAGLDNPPVHTQTDYSKDAEIVSYCDEEYVVKTGEGETDFVVKKRPKIFEKKDRQAFVDSFADDVGVLNVLKKVALANDETLIKQRPDGAFIDATQFPTQKEDVYQCVEKGVSAFDKLPVDIKKKMSMEQFVNTFGQEQFDALIEEKAKALMAKKEEENK